MICVLARLTLSSVCLYNLKVTWCNYCGQNMAESRQQIASFRAGQMILAGRTLKPDTRRGVVVIEKGLDLHQLVWCWKERSSTTYEQEIIIDLSNYKEENSLNSGEKGSFSLNFKQIGQKDAQTYAFTYSGMQPKKRFYWMQEPSVDKYDSLVSLVAFILKGSFNVEGFIEEAKKTEILAMYLSAGLSCPAGLFPENEMAWSSSVPSNSIDSSAPTSQQPDGGLSREHLQSILQQMGVASSGPSLVEILKFERIMPVFERLEEDEKLNLLERLPEGLQSEEELVSTLRNPQFIQAVQVLHTALQSGHLSTIARECGIDPASIPAFGGARALLKALQEQARKKEG